MGEHEGSGGRNCRLRAGGLALLCALLLGTPVGAASEIAPQAVIDSPAESGPRVGQFADRTLSLGILVDRDGVQVLSRTIKLRPHVAPLEIADVRPYDPRTDLQLEIALDNQQGLRYTTRKDVGPLCFEHPPEAEPHVEGDTVVLHRDAFVIELPDIAGFDEIEVRYHSKFRGATEVRSLGRRSLVGVPETAWGSRTSSGEAVAAKTAAPLGSTALWPEDFDDPDLLRIYGDPAEGDRRLNIVILPDGYTYAQKALMEQHADELVGYLRAKTPFDEHDSFINYTLVYAYSVESGTDQCDCDVIRDTVMGTRFAEVEPQCGDFANRCVYYGGGCDDSGIGNIVAAEQRAPYHDETIIMINSTRFGGCGGSRAVYTAGYSSGKAIAGHELGHSVGGLADEYVTNSGCGTYGGEVNASLNPVEGAWPEWIDELGPPREGARYWSECIYRAESTCSMRSNSQPFCAVCNQHWSLVLFGHPRIAPTAPIESISDAPQQVLIDSTLDFSVATRLAAGPGVANSIRWSVTGPGVQDPLIVASGDTTYRYHFEELGDYVIECEVVADTNFVKPARYGTNREVAQWNVEVVGSICEIGCAHGIPECDADGDGLGDACDPCPDQPLNECFGPVAVDLTAQRELRVNASGGEGLAEDVCGQARLDCRGESWGTDFGAPSWPTGYQQAGETVACDLPAGCPVDATTAFGCSDAGTEELLRCEHRATGDSAGLDYRFDVPDGEYLVNLLFLNGTQATQTAGARVFAVTVNGESAEHLQRVDPVGTSGLACDPIEAACPPLVRSAVASIAEGAGLEISLVADVGQPGLVGIEVLCATSSWHRDADGDGFGDPATEVIVCYRPDGFVADGTDCDDTRAEVNPRAVEICDNLDNDCDTLIDEDEDGDGFEVCADCDDTAPTQWSVPGEVERVRFVGKDRMTWDPPGDPGGNYVLYQVLRSEIASDFSEATCLLFSSLGQPGVVDVKDPAAGILHHYLIRADSVCGPGTLGYDSLGEERTGGPCRSDDGGRSE